MAVDRPFAPHASAEEAAAASALKKDPAVVKQMLALVEDAMGRYQSVPA